MARIASTTTAGVQLPGGGMTLDALMARQKDLAARAGDIGAPRQIGSPWQAAAQLAQTAVNAHQQSYASDQLAQGRQALAGIIGGINPETGATEQQIAQMSVLDPDAAQRAQEALGQIIRDRKAQEAQVAGREDTQSFEAGQTDKTIGAQAAEAEKTRRQQTDLETQRETADAAAAKLKREQELQDPTSSQGKIMRDFTGGLYGDPATPEAAARRDAALAKENALPGSGVTINTGDSGDLRKAFNKNIGEKVWPQYLQEASTAANLKSGMELLDAIDPSAQGPLVGRLAEMFPGVDSQASAFQSIVKRLAPQQRAVGSGSTSDIEYQGMLDSMPSLINNPEANHLISEMVKAQAAISIERGNVVAQWQAGQLDDAAAFKQINDLNGRSIMSPKLKDLIGQVKGPGGGAPVDNGTDPDTDALVNKYLHPAGP